MNELRDRVVREVRKVVVGQDHVVDIMIAASSVGGHLLLEGVPGVAKTLLANAFARAVGLEFTRVQFTPDMLPSDLTGTMTMRGNELVFRRGPVFTNLLLADEINRTPPKTQAALLESMQENQVSVDGQAHPLPDPFLVLATQNPIEYEGTYPLPEAQLDRFLAKIDVGYPDAANEAAMLRLTHHGVAPATLDDVQRVAGARRPARRAHARRRDGRQRGSDHVRRRARPAHARTAERLARRQPARRRPPARRGQGGRLPGRPRIRRARRRRRGGAGGAAAPLAAATRGRARAVHRRRRRAVRDRHGADPPMSPTPRAALALVGVALLALLVPVEVSVVLFVVLFVLVVVDARAASRPLEVQRTAPHVVARGVASTITVRAVGDDLGRVRIRQANAPDILVEPASASRRARRDPRRGSPRRARAPAGRGAPYRTARARGVDLLGHGGERADRLPGPPRRAPARDRVAPRPVPRTRSPHARATRTRHRLRVGARLPPGRRRAADQLARHRARGRPMSNQYRVEQDRDIICLLDAGRLMTAPIGSLTRLDAAVDAVAAVALVADEVGDRSGVVVFDDEIRRRLTPRRSGGRAVIQAILDVEPRLVDSDYDLAFRSVGNSKRGLVVVFTDLVDEAAARSLLAAVPVLARRHAVVVASVTDPDLHDAMVREPQTTRDVYGTAIALDVLDARTRVAARLRRTGAVVLEASPAQLGEACVGAYLRLKARARL